MRNFFVICLISLFTVGLFMNNAEAKRFGGGRSFGMQRSVSSFSHSTAARPSIPFQAAARPGSGLSKWLGPLAGLATGGLLAYLLMGHGVGSGMMSWLLIAGLVFFLFSLFRNKSRLATQSATQYNAYQDNASAAQYVPQQDYSQAANNTPSYPLGFDADSFLRNAKVQFIRLQASYDSKNTDDLREFTSPEVYAEIQLQFQERGNAENHTEVVNLDAELLDVSQESQGMIASVRFSGLIREESQGEPMSFTEIWHFRKDTFKPTWIVAGVQLN